MDSGRMVVSVLRAAPAVSRPIPQIRNTFSRTTILAPRNSIYSQSRAICTTRQLQQQNAALKQEERDAAATQPQGEPSLSQRYENEREKQKANNAAHAEQIQQQNSTSPGPIKTGLSARRTSNDDLLSRFDKDPSLDFLSPNRQAPRRSQAQAGQAESTPSAQPRSNSNGFKEDLQRLINNMRHSPRDRSGAGRVDTSRMMMPGRAQDAFSILGPIGKQAAVVDTSPPTFRIGPSLGRTVAVDAAGNMDLARAFRTLEIKCATNRVKQDFNKQRFHERGGTKRKRLASERWRRRFKEAFRATVRRVEDMRRKGW